jgi:hypothetical protein
MQMQMLMITWMEMQTVDHMNGMQIVNDDMNGSADCFHWQGVNDHMNGMQIVSTDKNLITWIELQMFPVNELADVVFHEPYASFIKV